MGVFRTLGARKQPSEGKYMSSKTISVKVPTVRLVEALTTKLKEIKAEIKKHEEEYGAYKKALALWQAKAITSIPKPLSVSELNSYGAPDGFVKLSVTFQVKDTRPKPPKPFSDYAAQEAIKSIESALRILALTNEEFVSTSAYKSVAEYL
jgi:hypothetical protein